MQRSSILVLLFALILSACGGTELNERSVAGVRFIGQQTVANDFQVQGTVVGGLSGIDYDACSNTWYLISDDRSAVNPARFYTARLTYDLRTFAPVEFRSAVFLRQPDGSTYPNRQTGGDVPDAESIRFDTRTKTLYWTSEGDRSLGLSPYVRQSDLNGVTLNTLPAPGMFKMTTTETSGSRNNATFEGLALSKEGQAIWVAMEGPLYQDGALPSQSSGAVVRLTKYDRSGDILAQYAYPVDAIPGTVTAGKNADNGISEILDINSHQLLALERARVQGADNRYINTVRLYKIDTDQATDIASLPSLKNARYTPVKKRLIQNINQSGAPRIDNLEGLSWGPKLPNGRDSLVLVSDNNFNPERITQFLAFEVLPE